MKELREISMRALVVMAAILAIGAGTVAADSLPNIPAAQRNAANRAKEFFERGDYREAEKIYAAILSAAPNNLYILSNLGVVQFRSGKLKQAADTLHQATTVAPNDPFSHYTLGIVYYSLARIDDAIKSLKRAIELNPENATAHNYLGLTYSAKGMQQEAAKELEIVRKLDPDQAMPNEPSKARQLDSPGPGYEAQKKAIRP